MKTKKRKFSKAKILLLFVIVIASVLVFWKGPSAPMQLVYNQTFVSDSDFLFEYQITKYPSNVEIVPSQSDEKKLLIGLVVDPWNLNFGIIPNGGNYGTRHLTISNFEEKKVKISLEAFGPIKPLVSFSKSSFVLQPKESASVDVFLNTTKETKPGNYTGEIDVTIQKPKYEFLYLFL